jgi:hypothetical protein
METGPTPCFVVSRHVYIAGRASIGGLRGQIVRKFVDWVSTQTRRLGELLCQHYPGATTLFSRNNGYRRWLSSSSGHFLGVHSSRMRHDVK